MSAAKISVILPVYNGEAYLREAVGSILKQTFRDFELLAIDDGSSDSTPAILAEIAMQDSRLKVERNEKNLGLIGTLNKAFGMAKSPLIARMDADDIAHPQRLELQHDFLEANPDIGMVGTWWREVDSSGALLRTVHMPATHGQLCWAFCFGNPLAHPTVTLRRNILPNESTIYHSEAYLVEDYDLWMRLATRTKIACLQEALYDVRRHGSSVSACGQEKQRENHLLYMGKAISLLAGADISIEELRPLYMASQYGKLPAMESASTALRSLAIMHSSFRDKNNLTEADASAVARNANWLAAKIFLQGFSLRKPATWGLLPTALRLFPNLPRNILWLLRHPE